VQDQDRDRDRKNCYENESSNYETETSLVNSVAYESKRNRYAFVVDYIFEIINTE